MLNKVKTKLVVLSLCVFLLLCSFAHAELKIDSVYPSIGKMGEPLNITISGSGFDENTRVAMAVDSGNSSAIIGSIDTPGGRGSSITVVNNRAYIADEISGLLVIDVSNPANPKIIGSVYTQGARSITVVNNRAYIASIYGLNVIDITNPAMPIIIGSVDTPGIAYYCGITVVNNKAYIAGSWYDGYSGLLVIDISDPENPKIIGSVEIPGYAYGVTVVDNRAYIANGYGLQVIDVKNPTIPIIIGSVNTPGYAQRVSVFDNRVYIVGHYYSGYSGLQVIDVSNPENPKIIGSIDTPGDAESVSVVGNKAYIADHEYGLQVIDVSNPESPKIIGSVYTPWDAYTLTVVDNRAYIMGYDLNAYSGLQVIDVNKITKSHIIGSVDTPGYARSVTVVDSRAYIADETSGLQVIDISSPENPHIIGSVDTPGSALNVAVVDNRAYIVGYDYNGYSGLKVIDVSNPANPQIIGSVDTPGKPSGVTVVDNKAYIADGNSGLEVIDVSNPENPQIIGSVDTPGWANSITVVDNKAYIAGYDYYGYSGLKVIDVSNPENPQIIGSIDTPGYAVKATVVDNMAYIVGYYYEGSVGLQVVDVSNPAKLQIIGSIDTPGYANSITVVGKTAYITDGNAGIQMIDVSNPAKPQIMGSVDTPGYAIIATVIDNKAYVADGVAGLVIIPLPVEATPSINLINSNTLSVTLPPPQLAGQYNIRVFNNNGVNDELKSAVSFFEPAEYWQLAQKKAIIVAGRSHANNYLWPYTKTCANMAYRALLTQGYTRNSVQYLSPENVDADNDGARNDVDGEATLNNLEYAISNWAGDTNELLIYVTDHGGEGKFQINPSEFLSAQELDKWLDALQIRTHARVILVYDACHSGSFLDYLKPPNGEERITITSAKANQLAFFNGDKGEISFSYQFWASVLLNGNLNAAFTTGQSMISSDHEPFQNPLIDANGDGLTNEDADHSAALDITICRGRNVKREPPRIGEVCKDQILSGETSATISVSKVNFTNGLNRIVAVIEPPGLADLPTDIPVTDLPTITLTDIDKNGTFEGTYDGFDFKGTYNISIYAVDNEEIYSYPARTKVIQNVGQTTLLVFASPKGGTYNSTQKVQLVASPADAAIYYTINGETPTSSATKYTVPITIESDTVLKFIAVDSAGNKSQVYTENYFIDTVAPTSPTITQTDNKSTIINPYPTFYWQSPTDTDYCVLQYSNSPDFTNSTEISYLRGASSGIAGYLSLSYTLSTPLSDYGNWYWRVKAVDKAGNQGGWSNFEFSFDKDTVIRKAIIVSSGENSGEIDPNFTSSVKTIIIGAYTALTYQNYQKSDIHILSSDAAFDVDGDGKSDVSSLPTKADFEYAITNWAADADDLVIFMVGESDNGNFRLNSTNDPNDSAADSDSTGTDSDSTETLTGTELDGWLDTLQSNSSVKIRVVYDAPGSGSFIPLLVSPSGKERIVVASSSNGESANFLRNGTLSFSYQFWLNILSSSKLYDSYLIGKHMMKSCKQSSVYDANGNGIANDENDEENKADQRAVKNIEIGYGRKAASASPVIGSVSPGQVVTITQASTNSSSVKDIWVDDIFSLNPVSEVWAIVSRPDNQGANPAKPLAIVEQTATTFDEILLQDIDGDKKYQGKYDHFDSEGIYIISVYVKDSQGYYSLPATTTVTVVKDGDDSNYVILTDTSPSITVAEGIHVKIIGSSGANIVNVATGARVECINFPGQNQININESSSNFTVKRSGAMVTLQSSTGTMVKIPATLSNQTIKFTTDDRSFTLVIKNSGAGGAKVMFGNLEIGLGEMQLNI